MPVLPGPPPRARRARSLFEAITPISSFQDLTKDLAPSSWSWAASAADVDAGLGELGEHLLAIAAVRRQELAELVVLASAFEVASGMVFTVNGAASALT